MELVLHLEVCCLLGRAVEVYVFRVCERGVTMPLVRYEVRCEHSLANPELYRSAGRDDPESLLEGVAMAGLVGIVRQLGDLAE